mgnify:CR=1 FL=1
MLFRSGLAWLGGNKAKYKGNLDSAAAFVQRTLGASNPLAAAGGDANWDQSTWGYAHAALFLGELHLANGGKKPSAELQKIADTLCVRQELTGGYGHGPGGKNALGYIELNILAAYVACGLSVLQQGGCKVDGAVLDKLFGYTEQSASSDGGVGYATGEGQKGHEIGRAHV